MPFTLAHALQCLCDVCTCCPAHAIATQLVICRSGGFTGAVTIILFPLVVSPNWYGLVRKFHKMEIVPMCATASLLLFWWFNLVVCQDKSFLTFTGIHYTHLLIWDSHCFASQWQWYDNIILRVDIENAPRWVESDSFFSTPPFPHKSIDSITRHDKFV